MADSESPKPAPTRFRLREIEMELTAQLHTAREQLRTASTEEERAKSREAFNRALERWREFATRQIVPPDLELPGGR